jgi:hypothetical protein
MLNHWVYISSSIERVLGIIKSTTEILKDVKLSETGRKHYSETLSYYNDKIVNYINELKKSNYWRAKQILKQYKIT